MSCSLAESFGSSGRGGGIRTPNNRFWRPALYQLELRPCDCLHYRKQTVVPQHPGARYLAANPAVFNLGMPSAYISNPMTRALYATKRFW